MPDETTTDPNIEAWQDQNVANLAFEDALRRNPRPIVESCLAFHRDNGTSPVGDLVDLWMWAHLAQQNLAELTGDPVSDAAFERIEKVFLPIVAEYASYDELTYVQVRWTLAHQQSFLKRRLIAPDLDMKEWGS